MSEYRSKLKANLATGEIEIEGSEEFIVKQTEKLESIIKLFHDRTKREEVQKTVDITPTVSSEDKEFDSYEIKTKIPDVFGEWIHKLPKDASDNEKMVWAGYFIQRSSEDKVFNTRNANQLLKDHGISITNPSMCLKRAVTSKSIFQVNKDGNEMNYRVTHDKEQEIKAILCET